MKYSPALDGVRAIAVTMVMLFHGGIAVFTGGFLGVDLFFVLSGFLITSLLLHEWDAQGRLDLREFWMRRARRLLPALFLLLAVVLVATFWMAAEWAAQNRADSVAAFFYVSNWWFIADGNSYFEAFNKPSMLLHTWSLAVEEQWYLILPLALVVLLPRLRGSSRRGLVIGFAVAALASATWMWWLAQRGESARAYYGTDTRVQSLLVGALVSAVLTPAVMDGLVSRFRGGLGALAWCGLGGFVASVLVFDQNDSRLFAFGFLAVAVSCAALILGVYAHPGSALARVLAIAPLVWIGRISYGMYLWHWPLFMLLSPERVGLSGWPLLFLRYAATVAVAYASYRLVEHPIRSGSLREWAPRTRRALIAGAPAALCVLLLAAVLTAKPMSEDSLAAVAASATKTPTPVASPSAAGGADAEPIHVVLAGDSTPLSLFATYKPEFAPGLVLSPAIEFGCGVAPYESAIDGAKVPLDPKCTAWDAERARRIAMAYSVPGLPENKLGVLFAGSWEQYDRWDGSRAVDFRDPEWRRRTTQDYVELLEWLHAGSPDVALVLNRCHGVPDVDVPAAALFTAGRYPPVVNDDARIKAVNQAARAAVSQVPFDVTVIDLNPLLCENGFDPKVKGVDMYTDGLHFTSEGAGVVWRWLGPRLRAAAQ